MTHLHFCSRLVSCLSRLLSRKRDFTTVTIGYWRQRAPGAGTGNRPEIRPVLRRGRGLPADPQQQLPAHLQESTGFFNFNFKLDVTDIDVAVEVELN